MHGRTEDKAGRNYVCQAQPHSQLSQRQKQAGGQEGRQTFAHPEQLQKKE
jgi:hypothetical protein